MRRTSLLSFVVVTLLVAGLGLAQPASAVGVGGRPAVFTMPLTLEPEAYADIETCIGESITITGGTYVYVVSERDQMFLIHANINGGTAVGNTTGAVYRLNGGEHEVWVHDINTTVVDAFGLRLNAVGTQGAADFRARFSFQLTMNANGVAVERFTVEFFC